MKSKAKPVVKQGRKTTGLKKIAGLHCMIARKPIACFFLTDRF